MLELFRAKAIPRGLTSKASGRERGLRRPLRTAGAERSGSIQSAPHSGGLGSTAVSSELPGIARSRERGDHPVARRVRIRSELSNDCDPGKAASLRRLESCASIVLGQHRNYRVFGSAARGCRDRRQDDRGLRPARTSQRIPSLRSRLHRADFLPGERGHGKAVAAEDAPPRSRSAQSPAPLRRLAALRECPLGYTSASLRRRLPRLTLGSPHN